METQQIAVISETGEIHGRGSDIWKWVSFLTKKERQIVRDGGIVLILDDNPHPACAPFKRVTYSDGRYSHKNAQESEMKMIRKI